MIASFMLLDWSVWWFLMRLAKALGSAYSSSNTWLIASQQGFDSSWWLFQHLGLLSVWLVFNWLTRLISVLGAEIGSSYVLPAVILGLLGAPAVLFDSSLLTDLHSLWDLVRFGLKRFVWKEQQRIFKKCHGSAGFRNSWSSIKFIAVTTEQFCMGKCWLFCKRPTTCRWSCFHLYMYFFIFTSF